MDQRQLPDDFKDFIRSLNSNNVRYLLVGGWAVSVYGNPRATKDIDFLVANDGDNLAKLQRALEAFGAPPVDMERFKEKGRVIRLGSSPIQIDIINTADGIDMDECYSRKGTIKVEDIDVSIISRDDLIKNKTASGRSMDIADAEKLHRYSKN